MSKEEFDKYGVSRLTLSDSSCLATSNETHYSIRAPLVGCGTVSRHTSETVIYSNQIINRIGEGVVTRAQEFQVCSQFHRQTRILKISACFRKHL